MFERKKNIDAKQRNHKILKLREITQMTSVYEISYKYDEPQKQHIAFIYI